MSKRRRTSSVASRGQDEESGEGDTAPEPARKKKKLDPVSTDILLPGTFYLFVGQNKLCTYQIGAQNVKTQRIIGSHTWKREHAHVTGTDTVSFPADWFS
jgi:hypothetical protein